MLNSNKVNYFELHRLRIGEQIEFLKMVMLLLEKYITKTMGMETVIEPFKKAFTELESRFKQSRHSKLSAQIIEQDELRDNDVICLRMYAATMIRYFEPEVRKAAELLLNTIDQFGTRIYELNYEEETAVIRNLINELKTKQELIDAVKKLNLKALVANLEKNNNEFSVLYMERVEEKTYKQEISAGEAIKEVMALYREVIRTIESRAYLEPTEPLIKTIAEINTIVQRHVEKLNLRDSSKVKTADLDLIDNTETEIG
jgi:hypothetical protein